MEVPPLLLTVIKSVEERAVEASDAGRFAAMILPQLKEVVADLSKGEVSRSSRRGIGQMTYLVEKTYQGDVLTERKGSGSKPYRCPQRAYEALASILEAADRPLLLDEILAALEKRIGDRPADHQVRVALRLWMYVAPPLVGRNRARYRSSTPESLLLQAHELWKQLQQ
jgi:hypothetical protein